MFIRMTGKDGQIFLGTKIMFDAEFISYKELKKIVQKYNVKRISDWRKVYNKLKDKYEIPYDPKSFYLKRNKWKSYKDLFGNVIVSNKEKNKNILSYLEIKKFVKKNNIRTKDEWYKVKLPNNIPRSVHTIYQKEWNGWPNFFDREKNKVQIFLNFNKAKYIIRKNNFSGQYEYKNNYKKFKNLPSNPHIYYKKEWKGWYDFLGKKK